MELMLWRHAEAEGGVVVVVGHQPTPGEVAALLISDNPGGLSVKKGGNMVVCLQKNKASKK